MVYIVTPHQYILIFSTLLFYGISLYLYRGQTNKAIYFLFLSAFLLRLFMIDLDPFLHDWDERFHALVAKNMMDQPFKPMLRLDPILPYDYTAWCCNHIWLHKQPLFLWQMALSMKIFGVSEWAIRLPSAILGSLQVILVFRIGKLFINEKVGFIAALLMSFSLYHLELISGAVKIAHNDATFSFYVLASIWAFCEYIKKQKRIFVILIGLFAGAAVLVKWLTGLLIFGAWVFVILRFRNWRHSPKYYIDLLWALAICLMVFLPWQIYTYQSFPQESVYESLYNARHIWEAIEGHAGGWDFYFTKLIFYYGFFGWVLLPIGIISTYKFTSNGQIKYALFASFLALYIFYSFVAQTKMVSYVIPVVPIGYIFMAFAIYRILLYVDGYNYLKKYKAIISTSVLLLCTYSVLNFHNIINVHFYNQGTSLISAENRADKINNTAIYKDINKIVPDNYVIFNCKSFEDVELMFYSDKNAYSWYPDQATYLNLKKQGIKMAIFPDHGNQFLPDYIKLDSMIMVLPFTLK